MTAKPDSAEPEKEKDTKAARKPTAKKGRGGAGVDGGAAGGPPAKKGRTKRDAAWLLTLGIQESMCLFCLCLVYLIVIPLRLV